MPLLSKMHFASVRSLSVGSRDEQSNAIVTNNDSLTYGVDGLRGTLIGISAVPFWLDLTVLIRLCLALATLGSYFFSKMEAD